MKENQMQVKSLVRLPSGIVQFDGELSEGEAKLVVELGLNYLIRAGMFPAITQALTEVNKAEEADMGYADTSDNADTEYKFPPDMEKND